MIRNEDFEKANLSMLKRLRFLLSVGLLIVLAVLILQPESRSQFDRAVASLSFLDVIFVALLFVLMRTVQALSLRGFLDLHGKKIGLASALNLVALKGLFNLAFSGLGLAAQSAQAKLALLVPVRVMFAVSIAQSLMLTGALGVSLVAATAFFSAGARFNEPAVFLILGLCFTLVGLMGTTVCLFPQRLPAGIVELRSVRWLWEAHAVRRPGNMTPLWLGILQVVFVGLRLLRILFIGYVIGPDMDLKILLITVLAADTLSVIPITPGGIGVRELLISSIGATTGHYEVFLSVAIIDRIFTIILNLVHGAGAVVFSGRSRNVL